MVSFAYLHARPNTVSAQGIFYVGKGNSKRRSTTLSGRNKYHASVIQKHGAENILVGVIPCSSEAIAFDLEKGLIKCLRRMGVRLSNMTDGGEGSSGAKGSEKQKQAIRKINSDMTSEERSIARRKESPLANAKRSIATTEMHKNLLDIEIDLIMCWHNYS